jgi:hypothetical protein
LTKFIKLIFIFFLKLRTPVLKDLLLVWAVQGP